MIEVYKYSNESERNLIETFLYNLNKENISKGLTNIETNLTKQTITLRSIK